MAPKRNSHFKGLAQAHINSLEVEISALKKQNTILKNQVTSLLAQLELQHPSQKLSSPILSFAAPLKISLETPATIKNQRRPPNPSGPKRANREKNTHQADVSQDTQREVPGTRENGPQEIQQANVPQDTQREKPKTPVGQFLDEIPTSEPDWHKKAEETKLSTPGQLANAFRILTLRQPSLQLQLPLLPEGATSEATLDAFDKLQYTLKRDNKFSKQLRNYSRLLFFCISCVARLENSVDTVDALTREHTNRPISRSKYWSRLRSSARWVAQKIETLENKLDGQASLLFLLYGPCIESNRNMAEATGGKDLVEEVERKMESFTTEGIGLHFSPAFLIAYLGTWTLEEVNKALGTNLSEQEYERRIESSRNAIDERHLPSPAPDILPGRDDGPTIAPLAESRKREGHNLDSSTNKRKRTEATEPPKPPQEKDASSVDSSQCCSPSTCSDGDGARLGLQPAQQSGTTLPNITAPEVTLRDGSLVSLPALQLDRQDPGGTGDFDHQVADEDSQVANDREGLFNDAFWGISGGYSTSSLDTEAQIGPL
ncbi:hypothetical protein PG997_000108 [Apiospora hydei]|uniref:Uncharacterized protein n=1 Tax=Apiospora hydei TaxID=1337664 RepID=A0ABR1X9Z7_9PEZI